MIGVDTYINGYISGVAIGVQVTPSFKFGKCQLSQNKK